MQSAKYSDSKKVIVTNKKGIKYQWKFFQDPINKKITVLVILVLGMIKESRSEVAVTAEVY